MRSEGEVVRVVPTMELAYLAEFSTGRVIGFALNQMDGYRGETFEELGIIQGQSFTLRLLKTAG